MIFTFTLDSRLWIKTPNLSKIYPLMGVKI